jgi:hypothetical protein
MSLKYQYTLTFRGEIIARFTSVYAIQHVVLGYTKPTSSLSMLNRYKTLRTCRNFVIDEVFVNGGAYSAFVVCVSPDSVAGPTEITECEILEEAQQGVSA